MKRLSEADREEIIESIKAELKYINAEFIDIAPSAEAKRGDIRKDSERMSSLTPPRGHGYPQTYAGI